LPHKRTTMKKIKDVIRFHEEAGLSYRQIAQALNMSRPTVTKILTKWKEFDCPFHEIKDLPDSTLEERFFESKRLSSKAEELKEMFPQYAIELKKKGVTLQLLWEEYIKENPEGLKTTQFNLHFQKWKEDEKISMHIDYKAGDKMCVDYTGHKLDLTDPRTGKKTQVEVFIAILPASQLTYVEASKSQNQEDFMRSNERAIRYFGGVPRAIVPDNLKSGVIKPDIYEPELNALYSDFAEYYRTTVLPARARKPKDKAPVENAVKIVYRRIFAPLRNQTFSSLKEINLAIAEKLEEYNNRKLTNMTVSRRELFDLVEKEELRSLPREAYPLQYFQPPTLVHFNYHVELKEDKHYYSVPYTHRKKRVKLIYDERSVSIYHDNTRIATHFRERSPHKYSTRDEHMPSNHRFASDWNPDKLKWLADNVGEDTKRVISYILDSRKHPEQVYKSCLGILNQAKKYGEGSLNMACRHAWNKEQINYPTVIKELEKIRNEADREVNRQQLTLLPENHENIRGADYYR
jgi:transposase